MRVAVFGDLSGWWNPFCEGLIELGVDLETGAVPEDLTIVFVGDLIHKGPDSDAIILIVDFLMKENPGQVEGVFGNHEGEHIGGIGFWSCDCSWDTINTLRRWSRNGQFKLALSKFTKEYGELLITHAGLTRGAWQELGKPSSPTVAAELLNELWKFDPEHAYSAGKILRNNQSRWAPGVVWAIAGEEVYASWAKGKDSVPFGQVHGHTDVFQWYLGVWAPGVPPGSRTVDKERYLTDVEIRGKHFFGTDPGFTAKWRRPVQHALMLEV